MLSVTHHGEKETGETIFQKVLATVVPDFQRYYFDS